MGSRTTSNTPIQPPENDDQAARPTSEAYAQPPSGQPVSPDRVHADDEEPGPPSYADTMGPPPPYTESTQPRARSISRPAAPPIPRRSNLHSRRSTIVTTTIQTAGPVHINEHGGIAVENVHVHADGGYTLSSAGVSIRDFGSGNSSLQIGNFSTSEGVEFGRRGAGDMSVGGSEINSDQHSTSRTNAQDPTQGSHSPAEQAAERIWANRMRREAGEQMNARDAEEEAAEREWADRMRREAEQMARDDVVSPFTVQMGPDGVHRTWEFEVDFDRVRVEDLGGGRTGRIWINGQRIGGRRFDRA